MRHRFVPVVALAVSVVGVAVAQELRAPQQDRDAANQAQRQERTVFRAQTEDPQLGGKNLDGPIAACLILGSQEEVALSQFAQQRAENEQVKQFAQKMIQDHQQAISQLQRFAPQEVSLQLDGQAQPRATQPGATQPQATQPQATQPQATQPGTAGDQIGRTDQARAAGEMHGQVLALQKAIAQECLALTQRELSEKEGQKFDQCYMGQQVGAHVGMLAKLNGSGHFASPELRQVVAQQQQTAQQHLQLAKRIMEQLEGRSQAPQEGAIPRR